MHGEIDSRKRMTRVNRSKSELQNQPEESSLTSPISVKWRASVGLHGGASSPPSALRIGKFGKRQSLAIRIIHEVFGENVTLYHVLGIKPSASEAEVRKAYLDLGKKALMNGGISTDGEVRPCELVEVPEAVRKRFQAVSCAYEILSTPKLRSAYDLYGDSHGDSLSLCDEYVLSLPPGGSVEWSPYVEQKFYDTHEYEESRSDEQSRALDSTEAPKRETSVQRRMDQENPPVNFPPCSVASMFVYDGNNRLDIIKDAICCIPSVEGYGSSVDAYLME